MPNSSGPVFTEVPYDPWGKVGALGTQVGPVYGSPAEDCDTCSTFDDPYSCGAEDPCDINDDKSKCYDPTQPDPNAPSGPDDAPGGPGDPGGPGGPGGQPRQMPKGSGPGILRDNSVNRPAQVNVPNSVGGQTAAVRAGIGQLYMVEVDLERMDTAVDSSSGMDGLGYLSEMLPWGQTRSYGNIEGQDEGGINGNRWLNKELSYLDFQGAAAGAANPPRIARRGLANEALWYDWDSSAGEYTNLTAFYGTLFHENDTYVFTDEQGHRFIYFDNSLNHSADLRGKLKGLETGFGSSGTVHYNPNDEVERVTFLYYSNTYGEQVEEAFVYDYYNTIEHIGMLKTVTYLYNGVNYRRVDYEYYGSGGSGGSSNDLKSATTAAWLSSETHNEAVLDDSSESAWFELKRNFYRYYTENSAVGFKHGLKFVLRGQASERIREAGVNPETADDATLLGFSDYFFEYDDERRVTLQKIRGGTEQFLYDYEANPVEPKISEKNTWGTKTTVTNPDGSQRRVYTNATSSILVSIFEDTDSNKVYDAVKRNESGWSNWHAFPTAIASVTEPTGGSSNLTVNYNTDGGLIYTFGHYTTTDPATGAIKGRPQGTSVQEGSEGTSSKIDEVTWKTQSVGSSTVYPVWRKIKFPETGMASPPTFEYENTFFKDADGNDTLVIQQQVSKLPAIPTSQNGDGIAHETVTIFNESGNKTWYKDARGYIMHWQYRSDGAMTKRIDDVDTSLVEGVPDGWETPEDGGLNLVMDFERDPEGRPLRVFSPWHSAVLHENDERPTSVRTVNFTMYRPDLDEVRTAVGYATGSAPAYGFETVGEVTITRKNKIGKVTEVIRALRECSCGTLKAEEEYPQKMWESWTKNFYDDFGRLLVRRVYHKIPLIGEGERGEHYGETRYEYDVMGRQVRAVSPEGTITRAVYNSLGLTSERWVGTNDSGATEEDPSGNGNSANNMRQIVALEYDDGAPNGNGLLTKETRFVDGTGTNDQVTENSYDYRTLLETRTQKGGNGDVDQITRYVYDNYGQITETEQYHTEVLAANLTGKSKRYLDDFGRVYKEETFGVASDGSLGANPLRSERWLNANGNPVKNLEAGSEAFTKTVYDGLNRAIKVCMACNTGTSSNDGNVSDDVVIEQTEYVYNAVDRTLMTSSFQRFHDATGTGPLQGPNGDQPKARRSYKLAWFDGVKRVVAQAVYGTNGGSNLVRPAVVPKRSDTVLVTSYRYMTEYESDAMIDPMGIESRTEKDALGRTVVQIENYDPEAPVQDYGSNRTTGYHYNLEGKLITLTLVNSVTGDQMTRFVYGVTLEDSGVARNDLLRAKIYPESGDDHDPIGDGPEGVYNRIEYKYDRLGNIVAMKDPNGTVHSYDYDRFGRKIHDRVTTIAAGIDESVLRITTEHDTRNQVKTVTSFDDADPASGSIVNQVEYQYNDFGQLSEDKQSHDGAADGNTPAVEYSYEDGSGNTVRRKSMTYPDGRIVDYEYGAVGSEDDLLSRVSALQINGESQSMAEYSYLGLNTLIKAGYDEPGIDLTFLKSSGQPVGDAGDPYVGYDRFGRTVDMVWEKSVGGIVVDGFQYGYSRNSDRTWKSNLAATPGDGQDEAYQYDGLNQVTMASRGELNINRTAISGVAAYKEEFSYDPSGNWLNYLEQSDGAIDLNQSRVNNKDNQIVQFDGSSAGIEYDPAGNATEMPPASESWDKHKDLKWDAWNRLVSVSHDDGSEIENLGTYAYDGTFRRITVDVGASTPELRHVYYNDQWEAVEERDTDDTTVSIQQIWGIRSRNDLIARDRDTTGSGTLDERLYVTTDAMFSGTSVVDTSGNVEERFGYSAFGKRRIMKSDFDEKLESEFDWRFGFHGEFLDLETRFVNYGYRYYMPAIGRWPSRDPIWEQGGTNIYAFVENNAAGNWDLFGEKCCKGEREPVEVDVGGRGEENLCCPESIVVVVTPKGNEVTFCFRETFEWHDFWVEMGEEYAYNMGIGFLGQAVAGGTINAARSYKLTSPLGLAMVASFYVGVFIGSSIGMGVSTIGAYVTEPERQ